jgi:hypothetical protein
MKKVILIAIISLAVYGISSAQEVGLRFGDVSGGSVAIDGVFDLAKFSRVHADLSFGESSVGIDALWDFINKPLGVEAFNWYLGVGPYMIIDDPFWFGVAGEAGLEYRFREVPIALGFDWRPQVSFVETTDFHAGGFGFNVRYVFGK